MNRLLITGASGDLGAPLVRAAARAWKVTALCLAHPERVPAGRVVQADLRDPDAAWRVIDETRPAVVVHAAVSERSGDVRSIERAAESVAAAAARAGCRLIFISTDMIFDGLNPPYAEDAPPSPISAYGRAKASAEAIVRARVRNCAIVRTSLIYDFTPANRQLSWMLEKIASDAPIPLFADEIRQPIWAHNLAEALLELATLPYVGALHIAGPERLSRWDYGRALLSAMGLLDRARVQRVLAAEVAPGRPPDLSLDLSRARSLLKTRLLSIDEARVACQATR